MYKVSVVILNWNGIKYLKEFIPFLVKYTSLPGVELVVADNASTDNSVQFLQSEYPQIRIIQFTENYGFAGGYNMAFKQIDSEYYVLLNSDVEVTPNWLLPIIGFMESNPSIGACMPKILAYHDRSSFEHAGAAGGFIDKHGYPFCRGRIFNAVEKDYGQYNDIVPVFWATGACMFVRSEAYFKAGELDARFFAHMEEIDLCWRMQWFGYQIMVYPESFVFHVGGGALPKENPRKTYLNFRNNLFLLYKNLPYNKLYSSLFKRMSLDFVAAFQFLLKLEFVFFWAVFKAHVDFYKNISYLRKYRRSATHLKNAQQVFKGYEKKSILFAFYLRKQRSFKSFSAS